MHPNEAQFISASLDSTVSLWNAETHQVMWTVDVEVWLHQFCTYYYLLCVTVQHIWSCNLISPSGLAPFFCSRVIWKSKLFHRNHILGTMDFTGSEHQVPFHRVLAQSWEFLNSWILGEFLERSLNSIFPWKVLKFLGKSLNFLQLWMYWPGKIFLMLFGCPRQNINHSSENLKVI